MKQQEINANIGNLVKVKLSEEILYVKIPADFRGGVSLYYIPNAEFISNEWHHKKHHIKKSQLLKNDVVFIETVQPISKNEAIDWTINKLVCKFESLKD